MRVLVVEDDKQLAAALRRALEGEGYAVDVALDGREGEWLASENAYDALVLDVMLPHLAGDELCARRRESGDWTPILMLTARSGPGGRLDLVVDNDGDRAGAHFRMVLPVLP